MLMMIPLFFFLIEGITMLVMRAVDIRLQLIISRSVSCVWTSFKGPGKAAMPTLLTKIPIDSGASWALIFG